MNATVTRHYLRKIGSFKVDYPDNIMRRYGCRWRVSSTEGQTRLITLASIGVNLNVSVFCHLRLPVSRTRHHDLHLNKNLTR